MGCKDDAGLRPRCDLLRKDSEGMYSLQLSWGHCKISPSWLTL